uniref:Uncharacterized protein n=1 Tax=viral metagenome TaxID=1070528 RepID=A0A6C0ADL5_9ZZZZ
MNTLLRLKQNFNKRNFMTYYLHIIQTSTICGGINGVNSNGDLNLDGKKKALSVDISLGLFAGFAVGIATPVLIPILIVDSSIKIIQKFQEVINDTLKILVSKIDEKK